MRVLTLGGLLGAAVLAASGVAKADDTSWTKDCRIDESFEACEARLGHAHDDAIGEGKDVRTSMEQDAQEAKAGAKETGREVKEGAEDTADKASSKADAAGEKVGEKASDVKSGVKQSASEVKEGAKELKSDLNERSSGLGQLEGEAVRNTLTTDPLAMVAGDGLNLQYMRPLSHKISGVAGANYSRATNAGNGAVTNVGITGGADYYLLGQNNEGLRVGPRVIVTGAGSTVAEDTFTTSLGLGGELGYNFITNNGITAGAAGGVQGRVAGTVGTDSGAAAGIDPYAKLNVGYSW